MRSYDRSSPRWTPPSQRPSGSSAALRGWSGFECGSQRNVRRLCRARLLGSMPYRVVAVAVAEAGCSATNRDTSGLQASHFCHCRCSSAVSAAVIPVAPTPRTEVVVRSGARYQRPRLGRCALGLSNCRTAWLRMLGRVYGKTLETASSSVQRQERLQLGEFSPVRGTALRRRNPTQLVRVVEETVRRVVSGLANVDLGGFRI